MKPPLVHIPLERYRARYTSELQTWEQMSLSNRFAITSLAPPQQNAGEINAGEVLDCVARPLWALEQMKMLLAQGPRIGRVYFSDFFTPGLEALAYSRFEYKAAAFCWAQTFDQYDFTRKLFTNWMRPWEIMAFELYSRVYVACEELRELIVTALPHVAEKVMAVGLPYNHRYIFSLLRTMPTHREFDLVYAARWDEEKQPNQFLDVVQEGRFKAVVCTGHPRLQGTDQKAIQRAYEMADAKNLTILSGLERADYFLALASSNVIFNCGLQDWISFTLLDALTFGCMPMYPAHRSFPRALYWEDEFLYPPGDVAAAVRKISALIQRVPQVFSLLSTRVLADHDAALNTITEDLYGL